MDTDSIMAVAVEQAGLTEVPADSEIYIPGSDLKRALFAIDVDVGELLFARDAGFDVVVAHHPLGGNARARFTEVMWEQVEQMTEEGIAEPVARSAVAARVTTRKRAVHTTNYNRVIDTARLIGLPLLNIHLPPDIVSRRFLRAYLRERLAPEGTVGELLELLAAIPEMTGSLMKPEVWIGDQDNPVGRYTVAIAGGTNGGYPVFRTYFEAGITTILAMHIDPQEFAKLQADAPPGCNLVITGHMATDSIGINRLIEGVEARGLEVTRTSGIIPPG